MSIYDAGDIIKGKTMNLIVMKISVDPCITVCEFGKSNTCLKRNMYREFIEFDGIESIACKDIIGDNCYFKKLDGGV